MTDEQTSTPPDATSGRYLAQYIEAGSAAVVAAATVADVYLHRPKTPDPPKPQIELLPGTKTD
jgi:hypothetical protein